MKACSVGMYMFLSFIIIFLSLINCRELQAKAKRLARFKDELSQPETSDLGNKYQKPQQFDQLGIDKNKFMGEALDITQHLSTDGEDQDSSTVVIGYCPNMCPGTSFMSSYLVINANSIDTSNYCLIVSIIFVVNVFISLGASKTLLLHLIYLNIMSFTLFHFI